MTRLKSIWLAAMCLAEFLCAQPVEAQRCDGAELKVGPDEARCVKPGAGEAFKDCPDCPEMVVVPAGSFTMGASASEEVAAEREDQVLVSLASPFAVGRFAVTKGEFAAFVAATAHNTDGPCYDLSTLETKGRTDRDWRSAGFLQNDRHPVVCVNWHDAKAYVGWLVASTGKSYRLLTETEREYVTRAGSTTAFWWGATISTDQANYNGNVTYAGGPKGERRKMTVPVDSFAPNHWGLYNVHGNVWDWTEDCWNATKRRKPRRRNAQAYGGLQPSRSAWRVLEQLSANASLRTARERTAQCSRQSYRLPRCENIAVMLPRWRKGASSGPSNADGRS